MPSHPTEEAAPRTRAESRAHSAGRQPDAASPTPPWAYESRAPSAPRSDWRLGGRTVRRWRLPLLAVALLSLGIAVPLSAVIAWLWSSPGSGLIATAVLWVGMLVPIVYAFSRSRPIGLLRLRPIDLLFGLALGLLLRLMQGWTEIAVGGSGALPSYPLVDGALSPAWLIGDGLGAVLITAPLEEFFFRGVVLVAVHETLRRSAGRLTAAIAGIAASTILFVLMHGLSGASADGIVGVGLLGLVCGLLVVLTGRIWGAVLVHLVYNATYVGLAIVGTLWG